MSQHFRDVQQLTIDETIKYQGALIRSVAHELNQPLMAIVASGETCMLRLEKTPPDIEKARAAAQRVVRDGHRASDVIKSIRALLKKAPSESLEFDPNRAIREVIDLTQARIRNEGISLDVDLEGVVTILGDRGQFQQVAFNLIANAIDAMVDVADRTRMLRIVAREITGSLTISVEDSGRGLDPGSSGKIYDAFFTTKPEGMGMGLAISRSIVELHGGRLWAEPICRASMSSTRLQRRRYWFWQHAAVEPGPRKKSAEGAAAGWSSGTLALRRACRGQTRLLTAFGT